MGILRTAAAAAMTMEELDAKSELHDLALAVVEYDRALDRWKNGACPATILEAIERWQFAVARAHGALAKLAP